MTTADNPEEMVNPHVRESDNNSQDEDKNDDSSVVSSRSCAEDFGPDRHADLTSPDICRVKHRRQVEASCGDSGNDACAQSRAAECSDASMARAGMNKTQNSKRNSSGVSLHSSSSSSWFLGSPHNTALQVRLGCPRGASVAACGCQRRVRFVQPDRILQVC